MHWMLCLSRLSILLSKHIHTFLPITFLIFNRFSIRKKFWKAETQGFSTIPSILYVNTVDTRQGSLMHSMLSLLTLSIQNTSTHSCPKRSYYSTDFQSAKSFGKLTLRAFQPYHQYYICRYCQYKTRISNAFNAIYVDTVDTVFTPHSTLYKVLCKSHKHQCCQCQQT